MVGVEVADPQIRVLGGERIVGDLRSGAAQAGQQGRFAGIGQTDHADVGDQFEFQDKPAFLAGMSSFVFARGLIGGRHEGEVAFAALAAAGDRHLGFGFREILNDELMLAVANNRAWRHADDESRRRPSQLCPSPRCRTRARQPSGKSPEVSAGQ